MTSIAFLSTADELLCESFLPVRFLPLCAPEKRNESPTHKHVAHPRSTSSVLSFSYKCCLRFNTKLKRYLINQNPTRNIVLRAISPRIKFEDDKKTILSMCDYQFNLLAMYLEIQYIKRIFHKPGFFYEF